jgi:hypothetical protein
VRRPKLLAAGAVVATLTGLAALVAEMNLRSRGGRGIMALRPGLDGTTTIVEWEETLVPPWLPAFGWLIGRPIIAYLYQRDLFLLRDVVEDAHLAAVA